jgi:hypothetical protein
MGYVPDWQRQSAAKTGEAKTKPGITSRPIFHSENVKPQQGMRFNFADGGEVSEEQLKREGLEASNRQREAEREKMSGLDKFVDGFKRLGSRLTEGNIDQPGSAAYNKYGAGRGMLERDMKTPTNNQSSDYSGRNMSTLDEEGNTPPPVTDTYADEADRGVKPKGGIFSNPTMKGRGDDAPMPPNSSDAPKRAAVKDAKKVRRQSAKPVVDDGMDVPHSTISSKRSDSQSFPRNDDDMNRRRLSGTSKDPDVKNTSSKPSEDRPKKTSDDFASRYAMRNVSPAEDALKKKGKPDNSFSTRYAMRNS